MLHENSIIEIDGCTVFMNPFAMNETYELMSKMIEHMAQDLSTVTGIPQEQIIYDYQMLEDYDPIREIYKRKNEWDEKMDKSFALIMMEKKYKLK